MRVHVRVAGFPDLVRRWGGDRIGVDLEEGRTAADLLAWLDREHARPSGLRLLDPSGRLVPGLVLLGADGRPLEGGPSHPLRDGDQLTLLVVVAGG